MDAKESAKQISEVIGLNVGEERNSLRLSVVGALHQCLLHVCNSLQHQSRPQAPGGCVTRKNLKTNCGQDCGRVPGVPGVGRIPTFNMGDPCWRGQKYSKTHPGMLRKIG